MRRIWSASAGACVAVSLLAGCGSEQESPSALETGREALQGCGILASNASLQPGQSVTSCDGRFVLKLKSNGDLVLNENGVRIWASHTNYDPTPPTNCPPPTYPPGSGNICGSIFGTQQGMVATMQGDGNFVIYGETFLCTPSSCLPANQNVALLASNTVGNPGATLSVQNDGNVVVYSASGQALWATNTHG